jgi:hypothetical protein
MAQQNVTISLSADLVREARHLAVDRGVSLSKFLALLLEEQVEGARQYRQARDRQLELLKRGLPLGTRGQTTWTRDTLHER